MSSTNPNAASNTISESIVVDKANLFRASMAGLVGTTLENYDFVIYGTGAALVFNKVFFSSASPAAGIMASFAVYGVGFVARPLGGLFFSHYGDRVGRKFVLVATLFLMGTATFAIGLLPTYEQVGLLSPILLLLCRILQGFGAGAEQAGGIVLLTETAPQTQRGRYASLVYVGAALGSVLGALAWIVVLQLLTNEQVLAWGWRVVFLSSIVVTIAAYIFRRVLNESPVFEEAKNRGEVGREKTPIAEAFKYGWRGIVRVILLTLGAIAHSYFFQVFVGSYVVDRLKMPASVVPPMLLIGGLFAMAAAVTAGMLSDRFGRKPIYLIICGVLAVLPYVTFPLLDTKDVFVVGLVVVLGFIFAVEGTVGVQAAYYPELFGSRYRYAGVALGREMSACIGGFAPLVAQGLLIGTGSTWPIAIFLSITIVIAFVTTLFAPETVGRDLLLDTDAKVGESQPVG